MLDELWRSSPAGQPVIVRDARWLIPLAQSLITDELAPYFDAARQVAETLPGADGLEIQKAYVRMLGGHLTSQIRYYCTKDGVPISEQSVVLRTRTSNALDFALLVQGLVGLLKAYDRALHSGNERMRSDMAGAICQGISADPELFLNRIDLLSAYSMIEHVFIETDPGGRVVYSPMGQRHVQLLKEYGALINQLGGPLRDDFPRFRPVAGACSPYGVISGLPSHLIEHMALKALQHDAETRFSLEDVFRDDLDDGDTSAAKLAWVNGWRKLPHIDREVQRCSSTPNSSPRTSTTAPRRNSAHDKFRGGSEQGAYLSRRGRSRTGTARSLLRFVGQGSYSGAQSEPPDRAQLLAGRQEGHFLLSYKTPGGWVALKKELLTEVLGTGCDASISGLPVEAARVLGLMCLDLARPILI